MRPSPGPYLVSLFSLVFLLSILPSPLFADNDLPGLTNSNNFRSFPCNIAIKELRAHSYCAYFQTPISHYQNQSFAHQEPIQVKLPVMGILKSPEQTARKAVLVQEKLVCIIKISFAFNYMNLKFWVRGEK